MYDSLKEICEKEKESGLLFWQLVRKEDAQDQGVTEHAVTEQMTQMYHAMKDSDNHYEEDRKSTSGLVGTDGAKIRERREKGEMLCGDFIGSVVERALRIAESNACMKRIVAAPTAGSCGVLPAVLISIQERFSLTDESMVEAVFVAGGIGGVIANRAFIAGAEGGCQAEIGSASAMAAGAAAYLLGGNAEEISNASALAMKSMLGLACDPVAGLVEVPCVKRNVSGAVIAVTSADMTMAGVHSKIPADEVIDAMRSIGKHMDASIRETGQGGLAATPTGENVRRSMEQLF